MGPNGSGKSTLAKVLAGHPQYEVTAGEILYEGRNLLEMAPDERAREGVFMAFQYPIEVPGVSNAQFLRLAYNEKRKHLGEEELDPLEFKDLLKERAKVVEMDASFMTRSVNEGFSGGEKKRNEILQMAVLEPKLAVLDETDSGLDIDALRVVAGGVNQLLTPDNAIIVVTHYQRLLNYIVPDFVHVLAGGRIAREGGKELALELEEKGYDWIKTADNGKGGRAGAVEWLPNSLSQKTVIKRRFAACVSFRSDGPWLELVRSSAMDRFEQLGFPSVRDEEWKYTNLAPLAKENFPTRGESGRRSTRSDRGVSLIRKQRRRSSRCCERVFCVKTCRRRAGSDDVVAIDLFSAVADARYNKIVRKYLARNAGYHNNGLTALNTAFLQSGVFLGFRRTSNSKGRCR